MKKPASETKDEFRRQGGKWLAAARSWVQWHCRNGSSVTWGSDEPLVPHLTMRQIEDLASDVAWAALKEKEKVDVSEN